MKHTIVALVEDRPGCLNRISSLFRRRGFNIESLTVGHSELLGLSRMTIVVDGSASVVEQVEKQLYKIVDVVKVTDITEEMGVHRELVLIKVHTTSNTRSEIIEIVDIFRANIVDVAQDSVIVEVTGTEDKIQSLVQLLKGFGVREIVRTGKIAMVRGMAGTGPADHEKPAPMRRLRASKLAAIS